MGSIKKHIFTIGISILALALVIYGLSTFYPDPMQECYPKMYSNDKTSCISDDGEWIVSDGSRPVKMEGEQGFCDYSKKCDPVREKYSRNLALISYAIGLALLLYGIKGKKIAEQTTAGFMGGGLLIIAYGTIGYWSHLGNAVRFFVVLALFGLLVWLGNKYKDYFK